MSANGKFDKFYVGLNLMGVEDNGIQRPISRVTLLLDDENVLTAGDDTGLEITADCPHATQEMVNAILAELKGSQYKMYTSTDAKYDPAAELGDGITVGDIYSSISRIADDGMGFPSPSAPGKEELEDEYPAGGPMTQAFNRKIGEVRSSITKTAEEIRLQVDDMADRVSSISTKIDSITLQVVNGDTSSTIKLLAGGVEIASQNISMNGLVTFTGLADGTTTIDGGCIKTGSIESIKIKGSQITGSQITGGTINGTSLSGVTVESSSIKGSAESSILLSEGAIHFYYAGHEEGQIWANTTGGGVDVYANSKFTVYINGYEAGSDMFAVGSHEAYFKTNESENIYCPNNIDIGGYSILHSSDKRLKTNIEPSSIDALSIINSVQTYSFDWRENGCHEQLGFIAQQLEEINPDFVSVNPADGHYSTKDMKIIPYLVKAVQELFEKIDKLEGDTQ